MIEATVAMSRRMLGREDWIASARLMLIESGVDGVKIDLLAKRLGVTRGSFYWHFDHRADLLATLRVDWRETNTGHMIAAIEAAGRRGEKADFAIELNRLWIEERGYSAAYDSAMRDWARTDPDVAREVRQIDDLRIDAFAGMFRAYGFSEPEATVRGRITYYYQVGYYTLASAESVAERERLGPYYDRVLLD